MTCWSKRNLLSLLTCNSLVLPYIVYCDDLCTEISSLLQGVSIKLVVAAAEHTAAVTKDGELYGWGWGRYGNLGLGERNDRLVPEKVSLVNECDRNDRSY
jgi:alpha-tubulin suppressor-like RCC1 family protein